MRDLYPRGLGSPPEGVGQVLVDPDGVVVGLLIRAKAPKDDRPDALGVRGHVHGQVAALGDPDDGRLLDIGGLGPTPRMSSIRSSTVPRPSVRSDGRSPAVERDEPGELADVTEDVTEQRHLPLEVCVEMKRG